MPRRTTGRFEDFYNGFTMLRTVETLRRQLLLSSSDDYLVFLYVSGYTGAIVYLRRYKDIHVSGLLSRVAIKLPVDEKGLRVFLSGQSLAWLFTYVVSLYCGAIWFVLFSLLFCLFTSHLMVLPGSPL